MEKYTVKRYLPGALAAVTALFITACSGTGASISVLRGNLLFRGGEDARATYRYMQAEQTPGGGQWQDWIDYDLGTLYVSLGEIQPGIRVLSRTLEAVEQTPAQLPRRDRELFFRTYFNLGVARFEVGEYRDAVAAFIRALRLKPDSWDAKINLELSIEAMEKAARGARAQSDRLPDSGDTAEEPEGEQLLQLIHTEEKPAWVSAPSQEVFEQDW